jgi:RNA polymerase sigma factor (sigma-70 family)
MSALGVPHSFARTEADLIGAVRSGDDRAFGELYSRYGGSVLGYVRGIVHDHGRAEDIAQEVFVSALRAIRGSDGAIAFKSWIYEIARNACIDEFRRARRCREVSAEVDAVAGSRDLADSAPSPHAYFERRQQLDALRGAFSGLSESQHKVLVQRELEGRSYAEIALHTGMSVPMVESTLFRARRRLGQEYDEIASGRRCEQVHSLIDNGGQAKLEALGLRERRRFARHVAHCQPCRRFALLAGIDESALRVPSVAKKIAALLPLPFVPWREIFRGGRLSQIARSVHRASQGVDPGVAAGVGQTALAAMAAAIVVTGGIGGGGSGAQHVAGYALASSQGQITRTKVSRPARPLSHQSGRATSAPRHATRVARRPSQSPATMRRRHHVTTSPATFTRRAPASSSPSNSPVPTVPASLRLPRLPGHPVKTVRRDLRPLLHKATSPVRQVTRVLQPLPKLPPPLKRLIRLH